MDMTSVIIICITSIIIAIIYVYGWITTESLKGIDTSNIFKNDDDDKEIKYIEMDESELMDLLKGKKKHNKDDDEDDKEE